MFKYKEKITGAFNYLSSKVMGSVIFRSSDILRIPEKSLKPELPKTGFADYIKAFLEDKTAKEVMTFFDKVGIEPPRERDEFLNGTEGGIIFLNKYGLVIRIEKKNLQFSSRVNDSGFVLQPIASIECERAIIEVCPGTEVAHKGMNLKPLHDGLTRERIFYWDNQTVNSGLLPIKLPEFPEGVPVVIDRLAVSAFTRDISSVKHDLTLAAEKAQKELYAPLQEAFLEGWKDKQKMSDFWQLCERHLAAGKLVAGWNIEEDTKKETKTSEARVSAKKYEHRL